MSGGRKVVYPRVESIFARKSDGQLYRHDFETKVPLIGEPDGSLRIPGRPEKWAVIDGEAWMVNAPVDKPRRRKAGRRRKGAVKAPARAKKNHALAVYALANRPGDLQDMARHRNRKGQFTKGARRRHARRRSMHTAAHTPRKYRRRGVAYNRPRRHVRRRHARRNPPIIGRSFLGGLIPPLAPIGFAVAGATATRFIANQVEGYFPSLAVSAGPGGAPQENKMGRTAIKIAAAILTGMIGGMMLGKNRGSQLAAGGLVIVTDELVRSEILPRVGLSEYIEPYEVVEAYVPPGYGGAGDEGGVPTPALLSGEFDGAELSDFMMDDFTPGRLSPSERLS